MAKFIALNASVTIDNVEFESGNVRSYDVQSVDEQVDVSGFNATGMNETLAGERARSITLEIFTDYGSGEMSQVLYRLHDEKVTFDIEFYPDQNNSVSATNPAWRGEVILPAWNEAAVRGEVATTTLEFVSVGDDGLQRYYT